MWKKILFDYSNWYHTQVQSGHFSENDIPTERSLQRQLRQALGDPDVAESAREKANSLVPKKSHPLRTQLQSRSVSGNSIRGRPAASASCTTVNPAASGETESIPSDLSLESPQVRKVRFFADFSLNGHVCDSDPRESSRRKKRMSQARSI